MVLRILFLLLFFVLTDLLLYRVILLVFANIFLRRTLKIVHLGLILAFVVFTVVLTALTGEPGENYVLYRRYFIWMDIFLLLYLPKLILLLTLSPLLLFRFGRRPGRIARTHHIIALRRKYVWIAFSMFITLLMLFVTFDGMVRGTSRFKVRKVDLVCKDLPPAFEGFTIAQFSDVHLGSWFDTSNVEKGLHMVQDLNADIIVFTGDLINVNAAETKGFESAFRSLNALGGKFAVTGNHDLGDFARFHRGRDLGSQLPALSRFYHEQGFTLLRNSHAVIHKKNDSIVIAGVDNWSLSHFKRYGDLGKALRGINGNPFTILLSHDPTHWKAEILGKSQVNLTLSGHTHGGQIGIHLFNFHASPVMFRYPQWEGLYKEAGRFLYVNPGFGFVGFSGRIGMMPEITLFRLHRQ